MTAEVKLLAVSPYVARVLAAVRAQDCADPLSQILDDYARACAEANVAERQEQMDRLKLAILDLEKERSDLIARNERLAGALPALQHAGTLLSNAAFNLAQDESLSGPIRWSLDDARKRWDRAADEARAALAQETTNEAG